MLGVGKFVPVLVHIAYDGNPAFSLAERAGVRSRLRIKGFLAFQALIVHGFLLISLLPSCFLQRIFPSRSSSSISSYSPSGWF